MSTNVTQPTNGTPDTDSARVSDEERTTAIKAVEVSQ